MVKSINDFEGYPRPLMMRDKWIDLNGTWQFKFDDEKIGKSHRWFEEFPKDAYRINVPFSYETELSGINIHEFHSCVWYSRTLPADSEQIADGEFIIHFEGVDYLSTVWINGIFAGSHRGGNTGFQVNAAKLLKHSNNIITVMVEDSELLYQPRGKQRWKDYNYGCWYVQTTGIWKNVWAEWVPPLFIDRLLIKPDAEKGVARFEIGLMTTVESDVPDYSRETENLLDDQLFGNAVASGLTGYRLEDANISSALLEIKIHLSNNSQYISQFPISQKKIDVNIDIGKRDIQSSLWSPEQPQICIAECRIVQEGEEIDKVDAYFAFRSLNTANGKIWLNHRPIFLRMILDQGYWEGGGLTAPNQEAFEREIREIKKLGFNGVRMHQKIEDHAFYYWCDRLGLVCWCEMPSSYQFSLPMERGFIDEWIEVLAQQMGYPSIISWVLFNESWGIPMIDFDDSQKLFVKSAYDLTKSIDSTRLIISNDGWQHVQSDVITIHDYTDSAEMLQNRYMHIRKYIKKMPYDKINGLRPALSAGTIYNGEPVILSEFGGISFDSDGWGYGEKAKDLNEFEERVKNDFTAVNSCVELAGYCYTQLTDVQQEKNGILNERRVEKIDYRKFCRWNCNQISDKRYRRK